MTHQYKKLPVTMKMSMLFVCLLLNGTSALFRPLVPRPLYSVLKRLFQLHLPDHILQSGSHNLTTKEDDNDAALAVTPSECK